MSREISARISIYRRTKEGPKFLVLYHGRGYWNFPKGKLEAGERGLEAALREVAEETGIKAKDLVLKPEFREANKFFFRRGKEPVFKVAIFFLAETARAEVKVSDEHEGYGWFLFKDALGLMKYQSYKQILKKANNFISNKQK